METGTGEGISQEILLHVDEIRIKTPSWTEHIGTRRFPINCRYNYKTHRSNTSSNKQKVFTNALGSTPDLVLTPQIFWQYSSIYQNRHSAVPYRGTPRSSVADSRVNRTPVDKTIKLKVNEKPKGGA